MNNRHEFWRFETAQFAVVAEAHDDPEWNDDWADAETIDAVDSGSLVAFCCVVRVYLKCDDAADDVEIGSDSLWSCVYRSLRDFRSEHRDADPLNRNCTIMRAARGDNVTICTCWPSMVREAVAEARKSMARLGAIRLRHAA